MRLSLSLLSGISRFQVAPEAMADDNRAMGKIFTSGLVIDQILDSLPNLSATI